MSLSSQLVCRALEHYLGKLPGIIGNRRHRIWQAAKVLPGAFPISCLQCLLTTITPIVKYLITCHCKHISLERNDGFWVSRFSDFAADKAESPPTPQTTSNMPALTFRSKDHKAPHAPTPESSIPSPKCFHAEAPPNFLNRRTCKLLSAPPLSVVAQSRKMHTLNINSQSVLHG